MNDIIKKLIWISVGQFLGTTSYCAVIMSNNLAATGLGGVAQTLYILTGINIQILLIILAIPIFLWAFFCYDKRQIFFALYSYFLFTFYVGIISKYVPSLKVEPIVATISAGVLGGIAGGIVLRQRVANGPESIIALYLKEKKGITVGTYFLFQNAIILCLALVYSDFSMIVFSFATTFISSKVTDTVIIGRQKYFNVNIMSNNYLDIAQYIQNDLNRGVTFTQAMDTKNVSKKMLVQTVVTRNELVNLSAFVKEINDDSFVYASPAVSVIGRGFNLE